MCAKPCRLIQWNERPVVVISIVGLPAALLDDEAFRAARSAGCFPIDVIFAIAAMRQPAFPIPKFVSSDVTGEGGSIPLLERCQHVIGFLGCRALDNRSRNTRGPVRHDHGLVDFGCRFECVRAALGKTSARRRHADREQKHPVRDGTRHLIKGLRKRVAAVKTLARRLEIRQRRPLRIPVETCFRRTPLVECRRRCECFPAITEETISTVRAR